MARALLSFLIAICFFTQGYGGKPEKEVPCKDADSCATLEQAKNAASKQLNETVRAGVSQLSKIVKEANTIRREITETDIMEIEKVAAREALNIASAGNRAFAQALKQGKELPVFECIVNCEFAARKQFPAKVNGLKRELASLQKGALQMIDETVQRANAIEKKLIDSRNYYLGKIRDAFSEVGVSYHRDQAMKAIANIMKESEQLTGDFSGVLNEYKQSAQVVVRKCEEGFIKLTEEAGLCMKGCLQ